jgi:DNA-3-methyladenine glycosylase
MSVLSQDFYERDTKIVAQEILGKVLVHNTPQGTMLGLIVETEAYF